MGHRWRGGPRGSKRFSLCQRPRQSTAKPGSEADVFISLGCARLDTENVITQRSNLHLQPNSCRGSGGRSAACFSVVRSGSPGRARGAASEQGRGPPPSQLPVSPVLLPCPPTGRGIAAPGPPRPDRVLSGLRVSVVPRVCPGRTRLLRKRVVSGSDTKTQCLSLGGGGASIAQRGGNAFGARTGQYCQCGSEFTLRFPATEATGVVCG